jgi:hypothetical protein
MFRHRHCLSVQLTIAFLCLIILTISTSAYDLTVRVSDTVTARGATSGWITVWVTNPTDSVGAFQVWLKLNRNDIIALSPNTSAAGTVAEQFRYYDVRNLVPDSSDFLVTAFAEYPGKPTIVRGFGPSSTEQVLARVPFTVRPIPPGMTTNNVTVHVETAFIDKFGFVKPNGETIGLGYRYVPDTSFYRCSQRSGLTCLSWVRVFAPPYDSIAPRIDTVAYLDTTRVQVTDGAVSIGSCVRTDQDFDINLDGTPMTVADYVALVRYVQGDDTISLSPYAADFNGDCVINYGDAIALDYYFRHGYPCDPGPCVFSCSCDHMPTRQCCYIRRGNLNGDPSNMVDSADLAYLVSYLTGGGVVLSCADAANVNGSGITDSADLAYLVAYLTAGGELPAVCP